MSLPKIDTMTCSNCGHVRWRHVFHLAIRGCMVTRCECKSQGDFLRAESPKLQETHTGKPVPQPAPPKAGWVDA